MTSSPLNLDSLYQDVILEHAKEPRNFGALESARPEVILRKEGFNPLCGDHVILEATLTADQTRIASIGFTGQGCSICIASTSIAMQESEGQLVSAVSAEIERFRDLMQGKLEAEAFESDLKALAGVQRFPVRIKCALLPWMTLRDLLASPASPEKTLNAPVSTEVEGK